MLESLSEIKMESPVDVIIRQLRALITSGELAPGDRLPAERKMAEKLGVSRGNVRDAIQKLEFYGILRTLPQSGTVVAGMGIAALEGLMSDVLQLEERDFASLVETRVMLEVQGVKLAAARRTAADLVEMERAMAAYDDEAASGEPAVEKDLLFHLSLADASKNSVLKSFLMVITPDIITSHNTYRVCNASTNRRAHRDHEEILRHIRDRNAEAAAQAMLGHLSDVAALSEKLRNKP